MGHRILAALFGLGALAAAPGSALAATSQSTNWAGYAIQRPGVGFRTVRAAWTQPHPSCRRGSRTYSSFWVGLGGLSDNSPALEQIGTEADCTRSGRVRSSAWWETVPAPSFRIFRTVKPGDQMAASVSVRGHSTTLILRNWTRNWTFRRTVRISRVDVSSAEWIAEAPSACLGNSCRTLPLADFGSTTFGSVGATTMRGHTGSLSDPRWQRNRIDLRPSGRQFAVSGSLAGGATASPPAAGGSSFGVSYQLVSLNSPGAARDAWIRAGRVAEP